MDDLYACYDRALDAVAPGYRRQHGLFFTDPFLARFFKWFARERLGDLGQTHLLLDPCCGVGNLSSNEGAPLRFQTRVMSDLDPGVLDVCSRRATLEAKANGATTVVLRSDDGAGLNFLSTRAEAYVSDVQAATAAAGVRWRGPIAVVCNPPYRSDDDRSAPAAKYLLDDDLLTELGNDAAAERYCCFLAQIRRLVAAATAAGMAGQHVLLLITKASWLTGRPVYNRLRSAMLSEFDCAGGFLVNSKEFFAVSGRFPVALTVWRHAGTGGRLDPTRAVELLDLTWLSRATLKSFSWSSSSAALDGECAKAINSLDARLVAFPIRAPSVRSWSGCTRSDFNRDKTKREAADPSFRAGVPDGDPRHRRSKRIGHADGGFLGFMDDLTPCRIRDRTYPVPYFHLDTRFMRVRRVRCFSGPPDNRSFHPTTAIETERLFIWYALGRTLALCGFPLWADGFELWPVHDVTEEIVDLSSAIAFADNECVSIEFPADNPVKGATFVSVLNPMTPLRGDSFWARTLAQRDFRQPSARSLIAAVDGLFARWRERTRMGELRLSGTQTYVVGNCTRLTADAGLVQIRDFARETADTELLTRLQDLDRGLRNAKEQLSELLVSDSIGYWDAHTST